MGKQENSEEEENIRSAFLPLISVSFTSLAFSDESPALFLNLIETEIELRKFLGVEMGGKCLGLSEKGGEGCHG